MIKWKTSVDSRNPNFNKFHYANNGLVLRLKKNNRKKSNALTHTWDLDLSIYNKGIEAPLAHKSIRVHLTSSTYNYDKNIKHSASKAARKLIGAHNSRVQKFKVTLDE